MCRLLLRLALLLLGLACIALAGAHAQTTTCADLRAIDQTAQPAHLVRCTGGDVEISLSEFHANLGHNGDFGQFCPSGPDNPAARAEGRWQTASGFPEVCDVFTAVLHEQVRQAAIVYFVHQDLSEQEIATSQHTLVYQGEDLVNFDPPVPGIIVGP
jgi:hypothetical protein